MACYSRHAFGQKCSPRNVRNQIGKISQWKWNTSLNQAKSLNGTGVGRFPRLIKHGLGELQSREMGFVKWLQISGFFLLGSLRKHQYRFSKEFRKSRFWWAYVITTKMTFQATTIYITSCSQTCAPDKQSVNAFQGIRFNYPFLRYRDADVFGIVVMMDERSKLFEVDWMKIIDLKAFAITNLGSVWGTGALDNWSRQLHQV